MKEIGMHHPLDTDSRIIELDRMLTRGEMAGEIAHEINNYLTILLGNVELLPMFLAGGQTDKVSEKLPLMKKTLEKIASFTENLSLYGQPQSIPEAFDLNKDILETVNFLTPQNRYDDIEIVTDLPADVGMITGDSGRVQQLIVNLLHNAADELQECEKPNAEIRLSTKRSDDGKSIAIEIQDNGRGISEEIRSRLFNERVSTKASGEGFGLLACKQIVATHGGEMSFETNADGGSCFRVVLPAQQPLSRQTETPSTNSANR
jgi:C4-dicarboxylate-specific signal transduction histidine kinase